MPVCLRYLTALIVFTVPAFAGGPSSAVGDEAQTIRNFHLVDVHVYRGAQPTSDGYKYLARIGVKTVLDLRQTGERSSAEQREVTALGMQYVNVPMSGLTPPTMAQMTKILALLESR